MGSCVIKSKEPTPKAIRRVHPLKAPSDGLQRLDIKDRYKLLDMELGRGKFGKVVLAESLADPGRLVAVK